jgi:hypothetical protein
MYKIGTLVRWLDGEGYFTASTRILELLKLASVEAWREEIERASRGREEPFASWFEESGRAYVPVVTSQASRVELISSNHSNLLAAMKESGFDWTPEELSLGRKGNIHFNGKFAKNKLAPAYLTLERDKAVASGLPIIGQNEFVKASRSLWGEIWENRRTSYKGLIAKFFINPSEEQEIETDNWAVNYDKSINFLISEVKRYFDSGARVSPDGKSMQMVVSVRPDDIAGMSTGRRWTSCTSLDDGSNRESVLCEITDGGFVAYLTSEDDDEIKNPVARIWIRRFDSMSGKSFAMPENEVYSDGREFPEFKAALNAWIESKQGKVEPGTYYLSGGPYSDTFEYQTDITNDEEITPETLLKTIEHPDVDLESIPDAWEVTDSLYQAIGDYFDHSDPELSLRMFHLEAPKIFGSKEMAEEWIRNHGSTMWKDDLMTLLISDDDLSIPFDDPESPWYDEDEGEPTEENHNIEELVGRYLLDDGLEIAQWADWNSNKERWTLGEVDRREVFKKRKRGIISKALLWITTNSIKSSDSEFREWIRNNPEAGRKLWDSLENLTYSYPDLSFSISSTKKNLFRGFPNLFFDKRDSTINKTDSLYHLYEVGDLYNALGDSKEKEGLRSEAIEIINGIIDKDALLALFLDPDWYSVSGAINPVSKLLEDLTKHRPIEGMDSKIVDLYKDLKAEANSYIFSDNIKNLALLFGAAQVKGPEAIEIYRGWLETLASPETEWAGVFRSYYGALSSLGPSGKTLIPLLEKYYRKLKNDSHYNDYYTDDMKDIYRLVKSFRGGEAPPLSPRGPDSAEQLIQELNEII